MREANIEPMNDMPLWIPNINGTFSIISTYDILISNSHNEDTNDSLFTRVRNWNRPTRIRANI